MDQILLAAAGAAQTGAGPAKTNGISLEPGAPSFGELLLLLKPLEAAARQTSGSPQTTVAANPAPLQVAGRTAAPADQQLGAADLAKTVGTALQDLLPEFGMPLLAEAQAQLQEFSGAIKDIPLLEKLSVLLPKLQQKLSELLPDEQPELQLSSLSAAPPQGAAGNSQTALKSVVGLTADSASMQTPQFESAEAPQAPGSELIDWLSSVLETAAPLHSDPRTVNQQQQQQQTAAAATGSLELPQSGLSLSVHEISIGDSISVVEAADAESGTRQFSLLLTDNEGGELQAQLNLRRIDAEPLSPVRVGTGLQGLTVAAEGLPVPTHDRSGGTPPVAGAALTAPRLPGTQQQQSVSADASAGPLTLQASKTDAVPQGTAADVRVPAAALAAAQSAAVAVELDDPPALEDERKPAAAERLSFAPATEDEEAVATSPRRRSIGLSSLGELGYAARQQLRGEGGAPGAALRRSRFSADLALSPLGSLEQSAAAVSGTQLAVDTQAARLIEFSAPARQLEPASLPQLNHAEMAQRVMEHAARFKAAGDGLYIAHLSLNPESLGEMHVNISVRGDNVALQIAVVSTVAREQLQSSLNALRQSLSEGGLNVAELRVINIDPDGRGSGNQRRKEHQDQRNADDNNSGSAGVARETSPLQG